MMTASLYRLFRDSDHAGSSPRGDTFNFLNIELSAVADPKKRLLQKPNRKMAARFVRGTLPTYWASLDNPNVVSGIAIQANNLIRESIESFCKYF